MTAFGLAWLAEQCGSEIIIGAFAAGLLVVSAPQAREIERGITEIGHFFVPLFFVAVGASVDLSALDPFQPATRFALITGGVLIVVGVAGKLAAGYAPFWFRGNKTMIGVGMVPRGEVGLIFAQMGLATEVFDAGLFGAVTLMVIVTTLLAPPCLKFLLGPRTVTATRLRARGHRRPRHRGLSSRTVHSWHDPGSTIYAYRSLKSPRRYCDNLRCAHAVIPAIMSCLLRRS